MLEVHAPHEALHTWQGFFIHIATIVIGLFIAVGLEQAVESLHHRHMREQLEEQMRGVLEANLRSDATNAAQLGAQRAYLLELRAAIAARARGQAATVRGQAMPAGPAVDDPRMATFPRNPSLAPYDAARENGTIALLPTDRIRIYNRVALQRELIAGVRDRYFESLSALAAFHERFVDSPGSFELGQVVTAPELGTLSAAELGEYRSIVAAAIKRADSMRARLSLFDVECRAVLDGVATEDELLRKIAGHFPSFLPGTASPTAR